MPGVWTTAVGYTGGYHRAPDLRGGLLRADRAHRGRRSSSSTRTSRQLRRAGGDVLRGARPDPGHAAGQRRRHPVPLGHLLHRRRAAGGRRAGREDLRREAGGAGLRRRSPPRSRRWASSTTPRATTSSTWPRTPTATAATARPASPSRRRRALRRRVVRPLVSCGMPELPEVEALATFLRERAVGRTVLPRRRRGDQRGEDVRPAAVGAQRRLRRRRRRGTASSSTSSSPRRPPARCCT